MMLPTPSPSRPVKPPYTAEKRLRIWMVIFAIAGLLWLIGTVFAPNDGSGTRDDPPAYSVTSTSNPCSETFPIGTDPSRDYQAEHVRDCVQHQIEIQRRQTP